MLEELKVRHTEDIRDFDQAETDCFFDDKANSIGAIIMHSVAFSCLPLAVCPDDTIKREGSFYCITEYP